MKILLSIISLIFSVLSFAQSECVNADFENGDFSNWEGQTGSCCAISTPNNGIVNGQHTIMTGNGIDPFSCGNVPVVAPGGTYSARLGNSSAGYGAERLRYTFAINPSNTLIIYKYAVILEDPSHPAADQPRFEAKVLDEAGQIIPCTYYYVAAGSGSDFQSCGSVQYKNWTTIGVDVSDYIGQNVTVDFATGDCNQGAHFGYAYVEASCAPFTLDARYCEIENGVNVAFLSAPSGFQDYLWSNGSTSPTTVVLNPQQGQLITCEITSVNGCIAVLEATLTPSNVEASYLPESACAGDTINLVNNSIYENSIQDSIAWSSSDGFNTNDESFSHIFQTPGIYDVQMYVQSDAGCSDSITQTIEIYEIPVAQIQSTDACLGELSTFISSSSISDNSALSETWTIDNSNYSGNSIDFEFNAANTYDIELVSTSTNNCSDTANVTITVFDNPVANFTYNEICEGENMVFENTSTLLSNQNEYHWNYGNVEIASSQDLTYAGFQTGENVLELVVGDVYTNVSCFDTIVYSFFVHGNPEILYSGETEFCEDIEFTITNLSSVETNENLSFDWQINSVSVSTDTNLVYTFIDEGIYPITLIVNSDFGCISDTTFDVIIHPTPEEPILSVTTPLCPMDPITFSAEAENNSTIFWTGPNEFSETNFEFTTAIDIEEMGYYTAYIISQYGCISDTSNVFASIININDFEDFDFPNIITANNDGINDELNLMEYFQTCEEYTLYIFNRWGNKVFEQTLTSPQFRGYTENGDELEEGVYFYKLVIEDADKDKSVKQGFIHVVKTN